MNLFKYAAGLIAMSTYVVNTQADLDSSEGAIAAGVIAGGAALVAGGIALKHHFDHDSEEKNVTEAPTKSPWTPVPAPTAPTNQTTPVPITPTNQTTPCPSTPAQTPDHTHQHGSHPTPCPPSPAQQKPISDHIHQHDHQHDDHTHPAAQTPDHTHQHDHQHDDHTHPAAQIPDHTHQHDDHTHEPAPTPDHTHQHDDHTHEPAPTPDHTHQHGEKPSVRTVTPCVSVPAPVPGNPAQQTNPTLETPAPTTVIPSQKSVALSTVEESVLVSNPSTSSWVGAVAVIAGVVGLIVAVVGIHRYRRNAEKELDLGTPANLVSARTTPARGSMIFVPARTAL